MSAVFSMVLEMFIDCKRIFLEVTHPPYLGHIGKCLWSPVGRNWRIMSELRKGDCIIHYISSKARKYGNIYRVFVGVSRVAEEAIEISKNELILRLKSLGIWNSIYEKFSMEWLSKYDRFYFIKLENFVEFSNKVRYDEVSDKVSIPQKYLTLISNYEAMAVIERAGLRLGSEVRGQGMYWLITINEDNWLVCKKEEIYGVPESSRGIAVRLIKKGDYLVFYVPKRMSRSLGGMFVGIYEVVSDWFKGKEPFWPDEKQERKIKYPYRVTIKPVKLGCVSLEEIKDNLVFIKNYAQIGLAFRGTPANNRKPLPFEDIRLIAELMRKCPSELIESPLVAEEVHKECVMEPTTYEDIRKHILNKLFIDEDAIMLINSLLDSGENVLLVGPPGTGKTLLAKEITIARKYEPYYVVATAHWSRFDIIGGIMLEGTEAKWHSGHLIRALVKHIENSINYRNCRSSIKGTYLIIDEVNRADVDKAFGEFFLIFSSHNPNERIIPIELIEEIKNYVSRDLADNYARKLINYLDKELKEAKIKDTVIGYYIPIDFRIIATMNQVDVRNLFTVGEAFARRFAIIEIKPPSNPYSLLNQLYKNILEEMKKSKIDINDELINEIRTLIDKKLIDLYTATLKKFNEHRISSFIVSPASLYVAIKAFTMVYLNKKKTGSPIEDIDDTLRLCIETSLPLSRLWDNRVKKIIKEVIDNVFKHQAT